jgi:hypothetical protein
MERSVRQTDAKERDTVDGALDIEFLPIVLPFTPGGPLTIPLDTT